MTDQYLTIPQLARVCELSEATVRRYKKTYEAFFPVPLTDDGYERFEKDPSIRLIKRINQVCAAGKRSAEVIRELSKEFQRRDSIGTSTPQKNQISPIDPRSVKIEIGGETLALLKDIAASLKILVSSLPQGM